MYGILDLTWKPSSQSTSPPTGKAGAIVRNDPYTHRIVVTDGWADLGTEEFEAQIRLKRLTGADDPAATADFVVVTAQDGDDLWITLNLTAEQTTDLPNALAQQGGYWDLQQVDGPTLLAGKVKVLDDVTRVA